MQLRGLVFTILLFTVHLSFGQLTIIVDQIPGNTPPDDPIYIAGDFQGWSPGNPNHILSEDEALSRHFITLPAGLGAIEFKFTRGSWIKVEGDINGNYIDNRSYSGNEGDTVYLQILGWEDLTSGNGCNGVPEAPGESTATPNVQVFSDTFYMPQLDRCRRIWVYLPPDYEESGQSYSVLYMHDAQNVFDERTSFISEWEVDETLNQLFEEGDPGIIVVGIDNGGIFRTEEYAPWPVEGVTDGNGPLYVDFIIETLKPVIDNEFRTLPDRENTGIMGSSFGGLISTYAGIEHQGIFSKVGTFSPSYWFTPEIYDHVATTGKQENMRIYQLMGQLEGSTAVSNMFTMEEELYDAGFEEDEVLSIAVAGGEHTEWFWAQEFAEAYLWLFRGGTSSEQSLLNVQANFELHPNPTNNRVEAVFDLSQATPIQIEVYNLQGQLVKAHDAGTLLAGHHQLALDFKLPKGHYYYSLQLGDESQTQVLIID